LQRGAGRSSITTSATTGGDEARTPRHSGPRLLLIDSGRATSSAKSGHARRGMGSSAAIFLGAVMEVDCRSSRSPGIAVRTSNPAAGRLCWLMHRPGRTPAPCTRGLRRDRIRVVAGSTDPRVNRFNTWTRANLSKPLRSQSALISARFYAVSVPLTPRYRRKQWVWL